LLLLLLLCVPRGHYSTRLYMSTQPTLVPQQSADAPTSPARVSAKRSLWGSRMSVARLNVNRNSDDDVDETRI
jgi:hypothetical protein